MRSSFFNICIYAPLSLLLCSAVLFGQGMNGPGELMEVVNSSEKNYVFEISKKIKGLEYASKNLVNKNNIYVQDSSGKLVWAIYPYERDNDIQRMLKKAEDHFFKAETNEARILYINILGIAPDYYKVMTYLGQTYYLDKKYLKAQQVFRNVISQNFYDFLAHWSLAETYYALDSTDHAVLHICIAHILNRNHSGIRQSMESIFNEEKIKMELWNFTPQCQISAPTENKVLVKSTEEWFGYALCKAIWNNEPGYRRNKGIHQSVTSLEEEKECIANLLVSLEMSGHKSLKSDDIKTLNHAIEKNYLAEYIYYEILLPDHPYLVYQFPPGLIKSLVAYMLEVKSTTRFNIFGFFKNQL